VPLHRLDHVLVLTDDLDGTTAFYRGALGFEVGARPELPFPGVWLYLDGVCCLHVAERTAYEAHAARLGLRAAGSAIDHVAFTATGYESVLERLQAAGVAPAVNAVPGGPRQVFFDDPNGVRVELNIG
jgi:catechol 2,3-dioxygenase-like lactoylglutathione lyase family enzyme